MSRKLGLLALVWTLCSLAGASVVWAVRHDWTAEERACAESIGVELDRIYLGPDVNVRTLTWISDLVVRGRVEAIRHDITGPYPTKVSVVVDAYLKGSYASDRITVNLRSGPSYSAFKGEISEGIAFHEPTFRPGEEVILFLTSDYNEDPSGGDRFRLGPGEYNPVVKGKYVVVNGAVRNWFFDVEQYPLEQVIRDIIFTAEEQKENCAQK